jgi:predicted transcriptional regulator
MGLSEAKLWKESGLARGTLRHHLRLLEAGGVIHKVNLGRKSHFFATDADSARSEKVARIQYGRACDVLREILVDPGVRQKDLRERLGMTRKVLRHNLDVLEGGALIQEHAKGRMRRYWPGQSVDGPIWSLFGLEKPNAEVKGPTAVSEFRLSWFGERGT